VGNAASIGRGLREHLSWVMSTSMIRAAASVTNATPVDTTNAANNWILTIGSPNEGVDGSRASPSNAQQLSGIEKIRNYDIGRDGPRIYLRNNVLYLQFLDRGWSQQADAGFVARALSSAAAGAPVDRRSAVRRVLRNMSRHAYLKTY
jgi:hypothetical protein